jgi:hypothetical protein
MLELWPLRIRVGVALIGEFCSYRGISEKTSPGDQFSGPSFLTFGSEIGREVPCGTLEGRIETG